LFDNPRVNAAAAKDHVSIMIDVTVRILQSYWNQERDEEDKEAIQSIIADFSLHVCDVCH
jgi:hypothetical protein